MQPSLGNPSGPSPLFGAITGYQAIQNKKHRPTASEALSMV